MGIALPGAGGYTRQSMASGAQVIDGSLRFDRSKSQGLKRTFSLGNRKTWTWSGWVKKLQNPSSEFILFGCYTSGDIYTIIRTRSSEALALDTDAGAPIYQNVTSRLFRDTNSWYHIVIAVDTNLSSGEQSKFYINGVRETSFSTTSDQPSDTFINRAEVHSIGLLTELSNYGPIDAHMSQVYFIDGQALGPESFGYTDLLTNTWRPKKFSGSFTQSSANDGTTWSSSVSGPVNSSKPLSLLFGGTIGSGYANGTTPTVGNTLTLDISSLNLNVTNVRLNSFISRGPGGGGAPSTYTVNGTTVSIDNSDGDQTNVVAVNGQLNTIAWSYDNGNGPYVYMRGIEVDLGGGLGYELLTDGLNNTGVNSFYLPMDGNSPIGEDKSGNGNNWTPVNFGGSVALDNPIATGARPILNTDGGGNVARPGVFGSEENLFYTVTTANGSVYQFDITSGDNPSLSFIRGATYKFDYSSFTGHPLLFSSTNPDSSTTAYTDGTSIASNVISFTVPHDAPDTLYYYCQNHPTSMNGAISITTDTKKADPYAWKNTLALPLVGISPIDVSNSINSGSTTKTLGTNGTPTTDVSNFYGGSPHLVGTCKLVYSCLPLMMWKWELETILLKLLYISIAFSSNMELHIY